MILFCRLLPSTELFPQNLSMMLSPLEIILFLPSRYTPYRLSQLTLLIRKIFSNLSKLINIALLSRILSTYHFEFMLNSQLFNSLFKKVKMQSSHPNAYKILHSKVSHVFSLRRDIKENVNKYLKNQNE